MGTNSSLREQNKLRAFENKWLRRISAAQMEKLIPWT
jgi:hypothetical protein